VIACADTAPRACDTDGGTVRATESGSGVRIGILPVLCRESCSNVTRGESAMLSQEQKDHLGRRLHEERTRLLGQLHAFEEIDAADGSQGLVGDQSKSATDPDDLIADADPNAEDVEMVIGSRMSQELAEIDAALDRLATSPETFGLDEETGEPIPFARLDIIPYARVTAQRKSVAESA
jgi:RNA polymerase-binding transcription factor DksA